MNKELKNFWKYLILKRGIIYETDKLMDIVISDYMKTIKEPEDLVKKRGKCKRCIYIETSICDFPCFRCNDYAKYTPK